jgi:hypothetical protein
MWCKTKQRKGSRPVPRIVGSDPRVSSRAAEMKVEARPAPVFLTVELFTIRQKNWGWKINDHPA